MTKQIKILSEQENWYSNLLNDLRKLEFTGIVLTRWNQGKRIIKEELKFGKAEYGKKRIENIAKDLGMSIGEIYAAIKFYKKFPKISDISENWNWLYITHKLLPEPKKQKAEILELPEGKYNIILADPPWKYNFAPNSSSQIEQHYDTMETEDIYKLKIPSAENAVLFLWSTTPKLKEALKVMESWGFEYKTNACWDKKTTGMGYWFLGQHELLLVGTKGNFSPPATDKRVSSVYSEKKTKHSKKPDYYYNLIEKMFPDGKYLELFARQKREKWISWGNEI